MKLIGPVLPGNFEFKATWDGKNEPEIEISNGNFQCETDLASKDEQYIALLKITKATINEWIDAEIKKLETSIES